MNNRKSISSIKLSTGQVCLDIAALSNQDRLIIIGKDRFEAADDTTYLP